MSVGGRPEPRVAVVGVGHFGRHHARVLAALPGVHLEAVVDVDVERAKATAAEVGTGFESDVSFLDGRVDAVTLAVPTAAHHAVALPLLTRGISVLVEKPIAKSVAEADELIAAAAKSGAVLAVGHAERYNPAVAVALPLVQSPRFIEVHRIGAFPGRSLDIDVVFDLMIHDLDIILTAVGSEVVSVEAVGVPVLTDRADIANARLTFETGCIANLTASRISREQIRKLRFFQQDAYISVDCAAREVEGWRVIRASGPSPTIEGGKLDVPPGEPLALELADFVAALGGGPPPMVDGVAGRRALALAERVAQAMGAT
ncbi:MAG: Gfo/Idh/MocA family oxidoreductase [Vicinamibacterales bacterium]|nr:Gfo/Idh/MocA family oxidoreductase [Vicinamibacterales bacterium]